MLPAYLPEPTKYDHITPVLKDLHWLAMRKRIEFKVLILTYKCRNKLAPPYLTDLLEVYEPSLTLRSGDQLKLSPTSNYMGTGLSSMLLLSYGMTYHQLSELLLLLTYLNLTLSYTCITADMVINVMYLLVDSVSAAELFWIPWRCV